MVPATAPRGISSGRCDTRLFLPKTPLLRFAQRSRFMGLKLSGQLICVAGELRSEDCLSGVTCVAVSITLLYRYDINGANQSSGFVFSVATQVGATQARGRAQKSHGDLFDQRPILFSVSGNQA